MAAPLILGLSVYLWIALLSLIILLLFTFTGHYGLDLGHGGGEVGGGGGDFGGDVGHDFGQFSGPGISPLSPPLVAAFGASFGVIGALIDSQGVSLFISAIGGAIGAAIIAFGLFFTIQRFLVRAQTSSDVQPATLVGQDAHVTIPIHPGAQGQILIETPERGRSLFPAVSQEDIPRDVVVTILGFAGGVASVRRKPS